METEMNLEEVCNVPWSSASTIATDWTLHQLAPYIGRIKTSIARFLIAELSKPGDVIADPFCGSGVIPFEALASARHVVCGDINPYAVLLTKAKLFAPASLDEALTPLAEVWKVSTTFCRVQDLRTVPQWVRAFFHPETLREILAFREACVQAQSAFLFACLLGILHHQRPGFLSFPSSHLVPYLRDRLFPRDNYPELYVYREVRPRIEAKLHRTYRRVPTKNNSHCQVYHSCATQFPYPGRINAVITSPPYMNELDYIRDNRLRLWMIGRQLPAVRDPKRQNKEKNFEELMRATCKQLGNLITDGGYFSIIIGDTRRGSPKCNTDAVIRSIFETEPELESFHLNRIFVDKVPDIRRSRRDRRGTKTETILIYRREK
jgi:DNA modification methylase